VNRNKRRKEMSSEQKKQAPTIKISSLRVNPENPFPVASEIKVNGLQYVSPEK
jgi:hypothetical protein